MRFCIHIDTGKALRCGPRRLSLKEVVKTNLPHCGVFTKDRHIGTTLKVTARNEMVATGKGMLEERLLDAAALVHVIHIGDPLTLSDVIIVW